jgi:hypothetical protein
MKGDEKMYESEDSWEDEQQKPMPETSIADSAGIAAGESGGEIQEETLRVPKDEAKSVATVGNKKRIPRWQWGVLAGLGVVVIGGGATFALMGMHTSGNPQMMQESAPQNGPDRGTMAHQSATSMAHVAVPSAVSEGAAQKPKGFATLNQFSESSTTSGTSSGVASSVASAAPSKAVVPAASPSSALPALSSATSAATSTTPAVAQDSSELPSSPNTSTTMTGSDTGIAAQTGSAGQSASNNLSAQSGSMPTSDASDVERLKTEISRSKAEIASLQQALEAEKSAASAQQSPRVITRTVVRYVHVPVPAVTTPQVQQRQPRLDEAHHSSAPASGAMSGWSVIGGNANTAMLSGPNGQVLSVRAGDVLPGGSGVLVQQVNLGKVITSGGVIR